MPSQNDPSSKETPGLAQVSGAHELLKKLQQRIGEHPELQEAITELEVALSVLAVQTGGLL